MRGEALLITLARKPLTASVAVNALTHGVGALNIDATRVGLEDRAYKGSGVSTQRYSEGRAGLTDGRGREFYFRVTGRWPANVLLGEGMAEFMDEKSGILHSQDPATRNGKGGVSISQGVTCAHYAGTGGASRFFKKVGEPQC